MHATPYGGRYRPPHIRTITAPPAVVQASSPGRGSATTSQHAGFCKQSPTPARAVGWNAPLAVVEWMLVSFARGLLHPASDPFGRRFRQV